MVIIIIIIIDSIDVQVFATNVMVTVAKSFEAPIKCKNILSYILATNSRCWQMSDYVQFIT